MNSRWFNIAVVVAWLSTMSWLVTTKILPPMLVGDPPSYATIIAAQGDAPSVGWRITLEGRPIGWALTDTKRQSSGLTEIHGRVHFHKLPLSKLLSGWMIPLARVLVESSDNPSIDARSILYIDPFGRLERFDSAVSLGQNKDVIMVHGTVEGRQIQLLARAGDISLPPYRTPLPPNSLLKDGLTPQTHLPGLRLGQTWLVPVYSPFPSKNRLEIIRATVAEEEPFFWDGRMERTLVVVYRSESGGGAVPMDKPRGRLWVRRDGLVLQQQALFDDIAISFVRMGDKEAEAQVRRVGKRWWSMSEPMMREGFAP